MEENPHFVDEEDRMLQLRLIVDRTAHLLMHGQLDSEEVPKVIQQTRSKVLDLFPDKGDLFDLIYLPRFMRLYRDWG
jgi:hypothetical protein